MFKKFWMEFAFAREFFCPNSYLPTSNFRAKGAPRGITLHRRVDIPSTPGKLDNLIELPRNLVCAFPKSQSPAGLLAAAYLRAAPALRFSLPHTQNRTVEENILICAFPSALHPSGQPAVALTSGRPALRFPPWPVKCAAVIPQAPVNSG